MHIRSKPIKRSESGGSYMERGIVHYGHIAYHQFVKGYSTCSLAVMRPDGETISLWKETLSEMGVDTSLPEPSPQELFEFVKKSFEEQRKVSIHAEFSSKYIASLDGTIPIPSAQASRLFSGGSIVYVDELIVSELFEYIATYYLWALDLKDREMYEFCFRYTTCLLNNSARLGILTRDERKAQLVQWLRKKCTIEGVNLIADLYWSCLAFAFCHEIAHIYLKHEDPDNSQDTSWKAEYDADAVGYEVYLHMIETAQHNTTEPFAGIFHDYLYTAPMILFRFFEDTYFMGYWLFGEEAGDSHPPLSKRFEELLRISEHPKYTFDTSEGNDLLNNYLDVSDYYREQLILKLQRGKLHQVIQEGVVRVSQAGYLEAEKFQNNMCEMLTEIAEKNNLSIERAIGLWDTAVDIELLDEPSAHSFVWSYRGTTYSTKAFNVRFSLKKVLTSILEYGATFEVPDRAVKTVLFVLFILYKLVDIGTIELNEAHAAALIKCAELHASERPVREEDLLQASNVTNTVLTELEKLGCVELVDGNVRLIDSIHIH